MCNIQFDNGIKYKDTRDAEWILRQNMARHNKWLIVMSDRVKPGAIYLIFSSIALHIEVTFRRTRCAAQQRGNNV